MNKPTLENYIYRYKTDNQFLQKHPENRKLLEKRIAKERSKILELSNGNVELLK